MSQQDPLFEFSKNRYTDLEAAAKYNRKNRGSRKDRLEKVCVLKAFNDLPKGSHVLDLPCGAGRMTHFLFDMGFSVTAADYSEHMVQFADEYFQKEGGVGSSGNTVTFEQQDVMNISHPDDTFDAILCNRLLHHYPSQETRRDVLRELARVNRGPLMVSFFSSGNVSTFRAALKHKLRGEAYVRRIPIPLAEFEEDLHESGLQIDEVYYAQRFVSSQTYVKASRR